MTLHEGSPQLGYLEALSPQGLISWPRFHEFLLNISTPCRISTQMWHIYCRRKTLHGDEYFSLPRGLRCKVIIRKKNSKTKGGDYSFCRKEATPIMCLLVGNTNSRVYTTTAVPTSQLTSTWFKSCSTLKFPHTAL